MNKKEIKAQIKELSELYVTVTKTIEKYNLLAKKIDFDERLALMTAQYSDPYDWQREDDLSDDEKEDKAELAKKSINKRVEDSQHPQSCSIHVPGKSEAWFPSDICPGY